MTNGMIENLTIESGPAGKKVVSFQLVDSGKNVCVESAKVRKSIPLKVFTTLIELVINPLECLNKNCGTLFCTSCLDQQAKQTNEKQCKVCKSMGVPQSNSSLLSYHAYFDQPSQVILKILNKYQLTCNFCRKPFTIKDI